MSRRRWIQIDGKLVEVERDYVQAPDTPLIMFDLPGYKSETTGLWIEGRKARREDLKRSGCRPYEGIEQEKKEAARREGYEEQRREANLDRVAHEAFYQLPPSKRDILKRI